MFSLAYKNTHTIQCDRLIQSHINTMQFFSHNTASILSLLETYSLSLPPAIICIVRSEQCDADIIFLVFKVLLLRRPPRQRPPGHIHWEELWQVWHCCSRTWPRHWLLARTHTTRPRWSCDHHQRQHPTRYDVTHVFIFFQVSASSIQLYLHIRNTVAK